MSAESFHAPVYLKPEVKLEPLVCRWYAWPHLLAPAQLGMNIATRFLPLLDSFVNNPAMHVSATEDPAMYGGPFVALATDDIPRVRQLIRDTLEQCPDLLRFSADYKALDAAAQDGATGYSLNDFYTRLPESLRGLIEFLYDINQRPSLRIWEDLLYDDLPLEHTQEVMMTMIGERDRPFFMSTPRIERPGNVFLRMPFRDERLDVLATLRSSARDFEEVRALLGIGEQDLEAFRQFFTTEAPAPKPERDHAGTDLRIRYFGHACVLAQAGGKSILFDPMLALEERADGRLTAADLPDVIDDVIITHTHQDHFCPEMLLLLRKRVKRFLVPRNNSGSITDPSAKLMLAQLGITNVEELAPFDSVTVGDGIEVQSLPFTGEHADLNIYSKQSILLKAAGRQVLFLIDSDGWDPVLYRRLMKRIGRVDTLFLGMECHGAPLTWLYEPLLTRPISRRNNESRRLSGADCDRAWAVQQEVQAHQVFIYAMGQENWLNYIMGLEYEPDSVQLIESNRFIAQCAEIDIRAERLYGSKEIRL